MVGFTIVIFAPNDESLLFSIIPSTKGIPRLSKNRHEMDIKLSFTS